jgi:hypothetical protein
MRPRAPRPTRRLARRLELPIGDAEDAEVRRAVTGHRSVAVDPDPRRGTTVLDVAEPSAAASCPPAPVLRVLHEVVERRHDFLADLVPFLRRGVREDLTLVVDRIAVTRMDGEAEAVGARQLAERMRARVRGGDMAADVVGGCSFGSESGRDEAAAGQRDDTPTELAEEAATAGPRSDAPLRALERRQLTRRSGTSSIRRSARSINPSTCSRLFTVPFARTTPAASITSRNGVPGTS